MEPDSNEWPLRDPAAAAAAAASADNAAGPRLSALLDHMPRFPKLPPAETYVYGSLAKKQQAASEKQRAQREAKQEDADLQRELVAEARRADGPVRRAAAAGGGSASRVRFAGGGSDPESDDGGAEMRDETDSASTASGSHPLEDDDASRASADAEDDDLAITSRARSPPDADAGPDEIAALPHSTKPRGTAAMSGRDTADELYDPHADEEDEAWMRTQVQPRTATQPKQQPFQRNQRKKGPGAAALAADAAAASAAAAAAGPAVPSTDAHLACPACFTPLCFDCQRHATRPTLFRAMFVLGSVLVDRGRQVRPEPGTADADRPDLKYFVVLCRNCKTHVGVMDEEEVFHFFNVIDSAA